MGPTSRVIKSQKISGTLFTSTTGGESRREMHLLTTPRLMGPHVTGHEIRGNVGNPVHIHQRGRGYEGDASAHHAFIDEPHVTGHKMQGGLCNEPHIRGHEMRGDVGPTHHALIDEPHVTGHEIGWDLGNSVDVHQPMGLSRNVFVFVDGRPEAGDGLLRDILRHLQPWIVVCHKHEVALRLTKARSLTVQTYHAQRRLGYALLRDVLRNCF